MVEVAFLKVVDLIPWCRLPAHIFFTVFISLLFICLLFCLLIFFIMIKMTGETPEVRSDERRRKRKRRNTCGICEWSTSVLSQQTSGNVHISRSGGQEVFFVCVYYCRDTNMSQRQILWETKKAG